jgi:hypothetical protein
MTDTRRRLVAAGRWAFGDRQGLVLWLALLCWLGATWRIGFFIQDTYATANTLVAVADGQLHVTELRYSITFNSQPGLHQLDGKLYGRNYGQLYLAVPLVWALDGLAVLVDPRLLLAGIWAGLGLALVTQLSRFPRFDRRRTRRVGAAIVAVLFVASMVTATDLPRDQLALVAYQLSTMVAAATAGLVVYRLFRRFHGRRVGLAAGGLLVAATPVGFWASIPKRHTLVAALTLGTVYAFAVSRDREGRAALRARAGAYALAGFVTSVHAFEALFLVVTLGVVDVLTARSNGARDLLVVGLVLTLAATPMLATNYAISGNPAEPPRLLPTAGNDVEFSPVPEAPVDDGGASDGGDGGTPAGGGGAEGTETSGGGGEPTQTPGSSGDGRSGSAGDGTGLLDTLGSAVGTVTSFAGEEAIAGVRSLDDTDRLYHTFVRSGTIPSVRYEPNDYEPVDLAMLEAMPILAALAALPVLFVRRLLALSGVRDLNPRTWEPERKTDLLVACLGVVLTVVYLPRLPLFSMLTVRYLHPLVALSAVGIFRIPAVRDGLAETGWFARAYLGSLGLALVVSFGGITGLGLAVGEAVQYNALWHLAVAGVLAAVVVGRTIRPERVSPRAVATGVALPAGFTTAYLLLSGLVYFRYGTYALDLVTRVAESLPAL